MFKTNFSGHNKILGTHKNWGALSPNATLGYGPICKEKVSHLDETISALIFCLNSSKSDDLRTNAFSTSTKCKSHEEVYFGFVGHYSLSLISSQVLMF